MLVVLFWLRGGGRWGGSGGARDYRRYSTYFFIQEDKEGEPEPKAYRDRTTDQGT